MLKVGCISERFFLGLTHPKRELSLQLLKGNTMTVGNDVQDFRHTVSTRCGTDHTVGTYWQRQWTGGDNPNVNPPRTTFVYDPENGSYADRSQGRPPKRGRGNGEHNYSMTLLSSNNPVFEFFDLRDNPPLAQVATIQACYGGVAPIYNWDSSDDTRLIGKLRDAIIGSDFNPAITLAEGNKSLQTIAKAATSLAKAYGHARKGEFGKAGAAVADYHKRGRKDGADTAVGRNWLKYQYGIKPILNDVYNAAITLAHMTSAPCQQVITVVARRAGELGSASPSNTRFAGYAVSTGKIKAILTEVNVIKLLGLTDPASVAWEKLPYSFVIDWFIPIGNFLEARGVANSLSGTFVTTRVDRFVCTGVTSRNPIIRFGSGIELYRSRGVTLTRTVSTSLSVPLPSIKPLSKMATWSHAASALALLTGRKAKPGSVVD